MSIFEAIILGVVEGLTEFLPISSTAHLVLGAHVLGVPESTFLSSFIIAIQLGAIASVVTVFWRTIIWDRAAMLRVAIAFVPTAIVGFLLYQLLKNYLLESLALIAWSLIIGGVILILFERWERRLERGETPLSDMPLPTAFLIGCIQSIAIVPGVSRAGATIVGGMALGIGRKEIVEFSFLLAIPTMLAATGYDLLKTGSSFASGEWGLLGVGFAVSFGAAFAGIRLLQYVATHSFAHFGWYRIVLGIVVLVFL